MSWTSVLIGILFIAALCWADSASRNRKKRKEQSKKNQGGKPKTKYSTHKAPDGVYEVIDNDTGKCVYWSESMSEVNAWKASHK